LKCLTSQNEFNILIKGKGSLENVYLDNFNNEFSYKYKNLKNRKNLYISLLIDRVWLKFYVILLSFDSLSKIVKLESL
jgi:hypothetical protein